MKKLKKNFDIPGKNSIFATEVKNNLTGGQRF